MSWIDALRATIRPIVRRGRADREMRDELAFHLERQREKNLAAGMSDAEATRAARITLGGQERHLEAVRDVWSGPFTGVGRDFRNGVRRLRRSPSFAIAALLTLALGIGANTAIFGLVRAVLLQPLPYADPASLVMIWNVTGDQSTDTWLSERELVEYGRATTSFASLGAYTTFGANLTDGEPERVRAAAVTASLFDALGVRPQIGRALTARDDRPGEDDAVVLGHGLWQRRFGGAADIVGRTIRVNGRARTVAGVMPSDVRLPLDYRDVVPTELWIPAAIDQTGELPWGDRSFYILGRLASGVTPAQATSDLHRAFTGWERLGFVKSEDTPARGAVPLDDLLLRDVRPALLVLFGAVGLILLIACANVAHLHLARADARRREVATQIALGASRTRLVRELLVESGVLAAAGAMLGTLLAWAGIRAALVLAPVQVIRMREVDLDLTVLAFTGVLIVAVTVLTGLWPALQVTRVRVSSVMAGARGDVTALRRGTRRALVVVETAVCLIPVLGAVLLARSFAELSAVDLGFRAERILTGDVQLPSVEYTEPERVIAFYEELTARLAALPGVESVGAVRVLPLSRSIGEWSITLEHRGTDRERPDVSADWQIATPGYLETVGIGIRRGRTILHSDAAAAPPVAVINETMAQRYWPDDDALGKRFHLGTLDQPWIEVVGIVGDVRRNDVIEDARAEMYLPHAQFREMKGGGSPQMGMTAVVRTAGDPLALAPALRTEIRAIDAALPVANVRTFNDVLDDALAAPRFAVLLLGVLAALSVVLAAIGLYGVLAFTAARRSHEIGIRVALGARRGSVARLIMREGVITAAVGIASGLIASLWLSRYVESQLYGVSRLDPVSYAGVSLFLLSIALLASYLPARRASRASPMTALRVD